MQRLHFVLPLVCSFRMVCNTPAKHDIILTYPHFLSANTASTIAGLAWFLCYCPYLFMQENYNELSLGAKMGAMLCSNTAMAYGFQLVLMFEGTGEGKY